MTLIAVGGNSDVTQGLMRSTDHGATWTHIPTGFDLGGGDSVAYSQTLSRWIAVGEDTNGAPVFISSDDDGLTWTPRTPPAGWASIFFPNINFAAWGNGLFVIGQQGNTGGRQAVATSPDGITWTAATTPWDGTGIAEHFTWDSALGLWIAGGIKGTGTTGSVLTSPDGVTWTARTTPFDDTTEGALAVAGPVGGTLIIGGHNSATTKCICTSTDGITWTTATTPMDATRAWSAAASPTLFVVGMQDGGPHSIMTSPDGTTWTAQTTPWDGVALVSVKDLVWDGTVFVAGAWWTPVGSPHAIMTSPDGVTWTARNTPFDSQGWVQQLGASSARPSTPFREYSAVIYDIADQAWTSVAVGFTGAASKYWTLVVDALVPAAGQTLSLSTTASAQFADVNGVTVSTTADAGSVLVVAVSAETTSGTWDTDTVEASGLTFTKRGDVTCSAIFGSTGIQRTQVWWAPVSAAFSGNVVVGLNAIIDDATVHIFSVDGANLTSPFDAVSPTTATGGSSATNLTSTFSTTNPSTFVFAVGANPYGDVHWSNFEPVATPTITSVSPTSGPTTGGTSVTITGKYFDTATTISFGASTGTFTVESSTQIVVTTPPEAHGTVDITITDYAGTSSITSADHFNFYVPITFRTGTIGGSSVFIPGTVQTGDYMLLFAYGFNASAPSPAGWTVLQGPTATANPGMNGIAFYRVAQGGDPGSNVLLPGATHSTMVAYANVGGIDGSAVAFVANPATTSTPQSPALTTTTDHDVLVYSWGLEHPVSTWPIGLTERTSN